MCRGVAAQLGEQEYMRIYALTSHAAQHVLLKKENPATELTAAVLDRISAVDDKIGA